MKKLRILLTTALLIVLSSPGVHTASAAGSTAAPCPGDSPATAQAARAAAEPVTVWLAGDSTMANPSARCPVGWGSQFAALFNSEVTVKNQAVGGRSIQTWLYDPNVTSAKGADGECVVNPSTFSVRWQAMLNASTGMKAGDYLFIQFGINDSSSTCPRHVGRARYQQLMTMMAQAALSRGAHPVVLTPVAAITCSGGTATQNRGFVPETLAAGAATGAPVIDLQALSVSLYNSLRFCPNNGDYGSGPVGAFFCNDHTHFETYGAQRIAGLVAGDVRRQNLPLATHLK
ncbi:GDSL-type esterase/lipase family protein [Streptomyces sp. NPDC096205]|uniref:GDSL-type esterase/lipase family protein n=1 Tax=Streptomyces sp. NPDC096205 TaxID=3366081 RepID=UPI0038305647